MNDHTKDEKLKRFHSSPVTIFSSHVYGLLEDRKGQYQDSNGSEAGVWHTGSERPHLDKVLYDDAADCWETSRDTYGHYLLSLPLSLPSRFGPSL